MLAHDSWGLFRTGCCTSCGVTGAATANGSACVNFGAAADADVRVLAGTRSGNTGCARLVNTGVPAGGSATGVATWDSTTGTGIPFQHTSLTATQKAALDTPWLPGDDGLNFVNYLRGDRTNESTTPNYRSRAGLVGDITDSTLLPVRRPNYRYSEYFNPRYKAFKDTWSSRRTVLYVGTNAGVLHAINGGTHTTAPTPSSASAEVDPNAGKEVFSYIPSELVVRSELVDITNDLATTAAPIFTTQKGWQIEVGKSEPERGWRVVTNSSFCDGSVVLAASLPVTTDACSTTGKGLLYGVSICAGKSALQVSGGTVATVPIAGLPNRDTTTVCNVGGIAVVGDPRLTAPVTVGVSTATAARRLNWREIKLAQ